MMIRALPDKPDIFDKLKEPHDWFWEGYNDQGVYGWMAIKREHESAVIHLEFIPERFKVSMFKGLFRDWKEIRDFLKGVGIQRLIGVCGPDDTKMHRILQLFGFPKPQIVAVAYMEA
jgi:hypothetical protein